MQEQLPRCASTVTQHRTYPVIVRPPDTLITCPVM